MPSQPPRRRRPQRDDRGLPLIPVLIGVVLLGFAVGAVLSLTSAQREDTRLVQAPPPTPQAETTPSVVPTAHRAFRRPKFTPYPAVVPTIAHTAPPTPAPVDASSAPTSEETDTPAPTAPAKTPAPVRIPVTQPVALEPTSEPDPTPTPPPAPTAAATISASTPSVDADSEFAQEAAQTVRTYLTALQRGDEDAASAVLAPGLALSEESFMSGAARVTRIHATGTSTDASVQARIVVGRDAYAATFSAERGPKGPIISAHAFTKAE